MSVSIPTPLRAAAGLAAAAIDEARRLPDRLVGLPVLAVSTALQVSLKAQQRYAELVARGDHLLEQLRGQQDGAPGWVRFDDEEAYRPAAPRPSAFDEVDEPEAGPADLEELAADFVPEDVPGDLPEPATGDRAETEARAEEEIDSVAADPTPYDGYLSREPPLSNYDQLTVAQLRGKLRSLSEAQLEQLVAYEQDTARRPPYLTMLENRLATLRTR